MAKTNGRPYPLIPKGKKLQVTDRPIYIYIYIYTDSLFSFLFILFTLLYMCIGYTCIHYVSYMLINAEIFIYIYIYIYIYLS